MYIRLHRIIWMREAEKMLVNAMESRKIKTLSLTVAFLESCENVA